MTRSINVRKQRIYRVFPPSLSLKPCVVPPVRVYQGITSRAPRFISCTSRTIFTHSTRQTKARARDEHQLSARPPLRLTLPPMLKPDREGSEAISFFRTEARSCCPNRAPSSTPTIPTSPPASSPLVSPGRDIREPRRVGTFVESPRLLEDMEDRWWFTIKPRGPAWSPLVSPGRDVREPRRPDTLVGSPRPVEDMDLGWFTVKPRGPAWTRRKSARHGDLTEQNFSTGRNM